MPVVFNNSTKVAEDLTQEAADAGVASGTHSIPLIDAQGNLQAIAPNKLQDALRQGFREPETADLEGMLKYAKYSSTEQQAKTFGRNALSSATMGVSDIIGVKTGMLDPQEVRDQDATNPGLATAGKVAGLVGAVVAAPEAGVAKGLEILGAAGTRFGTAAAKAVGAAEGSFTRQALQVASREAAQGILIQSGDEVAKQFALEPEKSIASSLIDVSLAGATAASFGIAGSGANRFVVQPLWKATKESTAGKLISALKSKSEGIPVAGDVDELATKAGVEISPEVKAGLAGEGILKAEAERLGKAETVAGRKVRKSVEEFKDTLKSNVLNALGKTEKDVGKEAVRSEIGKSLQDAVSGIASEGKKLVDDLYAPINPILKDSPLPATFGAKVGNELADEAVKFNLHIKPSTGKMALVNEIAVDLQNLKNFDQLKSYITQTGKDLYKKGHSDIADMVYGVLKRNEELAQKEVIDIVAPQFSAQYKNATAASRMLREKLGKLGEAVGIKRFGDAEDFIEKIADPSNAEKVLKGLTSEKKAELFNVLQKDFPELANSVRKAHLDQISIPTKNGVMDLKNVIREVDSMTPETREFVFGKEGAERLKALGQLFERIGKTKEDAVLDSILSKVPGGMGAILGSLGIGGIGGAATGAAIGIVGKEASDAFRLSMLKYIASGAEASGAGFKSMFEAANSAYRGAAKQQKAISSIFKPLVSAVEVISAPTAKSLQLLDRAVSAAQVDPTGLENISGDLGHYLPDHAAYLGATSARAMSYLASIKPDTAQQGPLEPARQPSDVEIAKYNRALAIAEQPLMVIKHVKDGTITPDDIKTISTIYPALYDSMKEQIMEKLIDTTHKKVTIPYQTRLGLSLFLGQPLERSIAPNNIMSNQSLYQPVPQAPQAPKSAPSSLKASKLPNIYSTPEQLREQKKGK
jgi:hypothetical protein